MSEVIHVKDVSYLYYKRFISVVYIQQYIYICIITYSGHKLPKYPKAEKTRMNTDMVVKQYHKCYFHCRDILRLCCGLIDHISRDLLSVCTQWSFYNLQAG